MAQKLDVSTSTVYRTLK
ncbi:hypothetical protein [Staphylococcus caprae]|nr:hypothetical protein [Staphylococcus caprae]MDI9232139.1 hypothetical protein [Staphylococcus caprae]